AGRVLLVCALCVLWCGVCCGGRAETTQDSPASLPEKSTKNDNATVGGAGKEVKNGEQAAPKETSSPTESESQEVPANSSQATQPEGGGSIAGQAAAAAAAPTSGESDTEGQERGSNVSGPAVGRKEVAGDEEQRDVNSVDSQHQRADQSSSSSSSGSSGTEGVKQPVLKENSKSNETSDNPPQEEEEEEEEQEDRDSRSDGREEEAEEQETGEALKKASNQAPTETHGVPTNKEGKQTATTQVNGQSSPEALEDVEQPEEVQSEKDSNDNPQTNSVASIAANQHNEPSADHGESGSPSPTANG
ncbi:mucin-associated surface protein (MASP), putative, partial [Trypanosoma cruzi]